MGHVTRQKPELFSRLHSRTRQNQSPNLLALQRRNRAGDGKVGLAGSGGANSKIDVILADALEIVLLINAPRPNHTPPGFQYRGTGSRLTGQ